MRKNGNAGLIYLSSRRTSADSANLGGYDQTPINRCTGHKEKKRDALLFYRKRQGSSIVRHIRTWRWEAALLWTRMNIFRATIYVWASAEQHSFIRLGHDVGAISSLLPRRMRTSGKRLYWPKVGRLLNVHIHLAMRDSTKDDVQSHAAFSPQVFVDFRIWWWPQLLFWAHYFNSINRRTSRSVWYYCALKGLTQLSVFWIARVTQVFRRWRNRMIPYIESFQK